MLVTTYRDVEVHIDEKCFFSAILGRYSVETTTFTGIKQKIDDYIQRQLYDLAGEPVEVVTKFPEMTVVRLLRFVLNKQGVPEAVTIPATDEYVYFRNPALEQAYAQKHREWDDLYARQTQAAKDLRALGDQFVRVTPKLLAEYQEAARVAKAAAEGN